MSWVAFVIAAWVLFGLELGMKDGLELGMTSVAPSFVVPLLVLVAMHAPKLTSLWAAFVIGLVLDLTHARLAGEVGVTIVGPYTLGCLLGCSAVLNMRSMVMRKHIVTFAFLTLIVAGLMQIGATANFAVRSWYDRSVEMPEPMAELMPRLGSAVYTALLSLVLGPMLMYLAPFFGFHATQGHGHGFRRRTG